jgi:MFS family permease
LAFLPVALAVLAVAVAAVWLPAGPDNPVGRTPHEPSWLVWVVVIAVIGVSVGLIIVVGYAMIADLWAAFRGDPIVMRGKVVKKLAWGDFNSVAWIFRPLFGYGLSVNVARAVRIGQDGSTNEYKELEGPKMDVDTSRRVHHRAEEGQEVFFVCTSAGRAVATLSDCHDDEAARELMALLDTGPAPEPEAAPEPS